MGKDTQKTTILREFSSGGAVFKKEGSKILWLVAKNNPSQLYPKDIWRLQKGWMDDGKNGNFPGPISSGEIKATEEDLQKGALREVREEGGVVAKIIKKIGTSKHFINSTRGRVMKFVTYYLMEYVKDAPEGFGFETIKVKWLPTDEAVNQITYSNEKRILKEASELLASVV